MYEDIVDYDDFSERVGSENDILDLIYNEIWKRTYCPKCERFNTHSRSKYASKNILCHHCSIQWSILQETIFFKTRIDLVKWSYVIYAISFYLRKITVKSIMELNLNLKIRQNLFAIASIIYWKCCLPIKRMIY